MKNPSTTNQETEQIVVFGYGSQGSAQAQNLRDSGMNVSVFFETKEL